MLPEEDVKPVLIARAFFCAVSHNLTSREVLRPLQTPPFQYAASQTLLHKFGESFEFGDVSGESLERFGDGSEGRLVFGFCDPSLIVMLGLEMLSVKR